jgi:hypothetical protein
MLTQERLKELLEYDDTKGIFTRRVAVGKSGFGCQKGNIVGTIATNGYIRIRIDDKYYPRSHLVWLYVHGNYVAENQAIDHINRNRSDDRICNLRIVENIDNYKNMKKFNTNKSGTTGVAWHKKAGKWRAYIMINYKQVHLGLFSTIEQAIDARDKANILYGFDPTHGKEPLLNF